MEGEEKNRKMNEVMKELYLIKREGINSLLLSTFVRVFWWGVKFKNLHSMND